MLLYFFLFFIAYLPKKMETEKWSKAADSPLQYHKIAVTKLVTALSHF